MGRCLEQREETFVENKKYSIGVDLDVQTDQFYVHVFLSEYSVTEWRFLGRIFKWVSQVEDNLW